MDPKRKVGKEKTCTMLVVRLYVCFIFFFFCWLFTDDLLGLDSTLICCLCSERVIRTLAHELHHFELGKSELGWHLEELENLAKELPEEEEEDEGSDSDEEEEEDEGSDSDEDSDDSDDTSSDDDSSSSSSDNEEVEEGQDREVSQSDTVVADEDQSIFMHEGPRPKIIEL